MDTIIQFDEKSIFSNLYPATVRLGGNMFDSVERAYWTRLSIFPSERDSIKYIKNEDIDSVASRTFTVRPDWDDVSEITMKAAVVSKFISNGEFISAILDTGNATLIHEHEDDEENRLGKILMESRTLIRKYANSPNPKRSFGDLRKRLALAGTPRNYLIVNAFLNTPDPEPLLIMAGDAIAGCRASFKARQTDCVFVGMPDDEVLISRIEAFLKLAGEKAIHSAQIGTECGYALSFNKVALKDLYEEPERVR